MKYVDESFPALEDITPVEDIEQMLNVATPASISSISVSDVEGIEANDENFLTSLWKANYYSPHP